MTALARSLPGQRAPQQARSREKFERLLSVGAVMVAEHGFGALRLADVAKAADCSVGVIYQRFTDKEGFLLALRDRFCAELTANADIAVVNAALDTYTTFDVLAYIINNHVDIFRANRGFLIALAQLGMADKSAWAPVRALADHVANVAASTIANRPDVECRDPRARMTYAMQMIDSTLLSALTGHFGPLGIDDQDLSRQLITMAARYLDLRRTGPKGGD